MGAGIALAMMVIIGVLGMLGRRVTSNKPSKEDEYVQKGATKEIETGSIEQVGGIIEDEAWGEDVAALLDMSDTSTEEEEETSVPEGKSRSVTDSVDSESSEHSDEDVDDGSGEWQQGEQGWQVYDGNSSDTPVAEEGLQKPQLLKRPLLPRHHLFLKAAYLLDGRWISGNGMAMSGLRRMVVSDYWKSTGSTRLNCCRFSPLKGSVSATRASSISPRSTVFHSRPLDMSST